MSQNEMIVLTDVVLITAIVQRGTADRVVQAAQEAGAQGATIFHAHGTGVRQKRLGILGLTINAEKEVLYIVAPTDQADAIFLFIHIQYNNLYHIAHGQHLRGVLDEFT